MYLFFPELLTQWQVIKKSISENEILDVGIYLIM